MKGFTAAQSRYEDLLPEDDECEFCVSGICVEHDVYDIKIRLKDLGYSSEVISCGITVLTYGRIEFFGTEEQVMNWLEENEEI